MAVADQTGTGGDAGTQPKADSTTSAAAASGASQGAQGQQQQQAPAQGSQGQQPSQPTATGATSGEKKTYTYEEDRSNWNPPHRLREVTQRLRQHEADLDFLRRQNAALSGVKYQPPQRPESPEVAQIRRQFGELYPGLAKLAALDPDKLERLEQLAGMDPDEFSAPQEHYWNVIGNQTINTLVKEVEGVIGGQLNPFSKRQLAAGFKAWIESDQDILGRYTMQDPSLIADFLKEYQGGILDPFRRKATATVQAGARRVAKLPQQGASGVVAGATPAKPSLDDEEAVHAAAWKRFEQSQQTV